MRTLILYSSKYGFTEHIAKILADHIEGDVVVDRCGKDYSIDLTRFDNIIIGSSIYVGKPNTAVLDFCDSYQRLLMNKRIGFFVTGAQENEALDVLKKSFQENLVTRAKAIGYFGYELNFEKMRFLDRFMTQIVARKTESEIKILVEEIEAFADAFKE